MIYTLLCLFLLISIALSALPVTHVMSVFPLLFLMYWGLSKPSAAVLWAGFVVGLLLDLIANSPLGLHAFSLALILFFWQTAQPMLRRCPILLQIPIVLLVTFLYLLISQILMYATHHYFNLSMASQSLLLTVIAWPFVFVLMRSIEKRVLK